MASSVRLLSISALYVLMNPVPGRPVKRDPYAASMQCSSSIVIADLQWVSG